MKEALLDTNLLLALAWPFHIHHEQAHDWFAENAPNGWATCPITECGFVRISSNPKIVTGAVSIKEALTALAKIKSGRHCRFWPAGLSLCDTAAIPSELLVGHNQVTDAYLLGLAISNQGRLATFDRGLLSLLPQSSPHRKAVELIQV